MAKVFGGKAAHRPPLRLAGSAAAIALATGFGGGLALGQQQVAQAPQSLETVEVTGSRILNSDALSASPITVVSAATIQQQKAETVEDILRKTPAIDFTGTFTGNDNNGGLGVSQASLRNLGPQRTLVLVNGQRFPFTDIQQPSGASVDLNNIPVPMIDHIEVLRDGASSIYGADAIGGVINVITKKNFQGVEVGGSVGETSYGDGLTYSTYSILGTNFDRGNILINVSYDHRDYIPGSARSWFTDEHPDSDVYYGLMSSGRIPGTRAITSKGSFFFYNQSGGFAPYFSDSFWTTHANLLPPGDFYIPTTTPALTAGIRFNYQPTEGLIGALDRKQLNFTGNYDLFEGVTALVDAFYTNRNSQELLNPEPLGVGITTPKYPQGLFVPQYLENGLDASGNPIYVYSSAGALIPNPSNPTNPTSPFYNPAFAAAAGGPQDMVLETRRFEAGPRIYSDDTNTYRIHGGLTGTIEDYTWEVGYFFGKDTARYDVANEVNFEHLAQMAGMIPCGPDPSCGPANFFGFQSLTPTQAKYLVFTNTDNSGYEESDAYGSITGPVVNLPAGPLKAAIGFEYRSESTFDDPSPIVSNGDASVYNLPTSGQYTTASGYAEINVPVLKDVPFAKLLTIDASARYDYNTTFNRALTYKAGVDYAVTDDFRFRGSRATGFRAPQLRELYSGGTFGAFSGSDPCAPGGNFVTSTACLIANGGDPNNLVQQSGQITGLQEGAAAAGGSLKPETAQQWSLGAVVTPTLVPGLSATVDYYTILIRNEITQLDPYRVAEACYGGVAYLISPAQACNDIVRSGRNAAGQAVGNLAYVITPTGNVAAENTDGLDFAVDYGFDTAMIGMPGFGHIDLNGQANYLISDNTFNNGIEVQQAGTQFSSGGGGAEPRWKAVLSATVSSNDGWSFNWTERYYGGAKQSAGNVAPDPISSPTGDCVGSSITVGCGDYYGNETGGTFFSDISLTYAYQTVRVTVGVDNLFDRSPPFAYFNGNPYLTDAGYDALGRFVFMKASIDFGAAAAPAAAPPTPAVPTAAPPPPPPPAKVEAQREFQVFFDFDKSNITAAAARVIQAAADVIKSGGVAHITVTGHTDTVGTAAYNLALSQRRAASVKQQLVSDGVGAGEITTIGVGKSGLLVPTADGVREPQNRRAVIELK